MRKLIFALLVLFNADAFGYAFEHPWAGKRIVYFGDSITDPNVLEDHTHYWSYLHQWLNAYDVCRFLIRIHSVAGSIMLSTA